jgi:D-serine deaminase-like pyridoxal phosphate-dependent protein
MVNRRKLLTSTTSLAASALAGNLLWAPHARGLAPASGHDAYFSGLNDLLKRDGPGHPVMLLDAARINHNLDQIIKSVGRDKQYRVVVKSLPSVPLLKHVTERAKTNALMVFHQPFLNTIADTFSSADVLIGKPMPVQAARSFYKKQRNKKFNSAKQVQWLIDSQERLLQYQALARELGVNMGINFEIDVGLHRGGLAQPEALSAALEVIEADPKHLQLRGLMGYEPQLTGLKADLNHPSVREVLKIYRGFIDRVKAKGHDVEKLTLNGAGSHTLKIYERDQTMNDLSAGSGVVMPTDFDTHHLRGNQPGLFIATPILKRYSKNPVMPNPPELMERIYYIYGGYWKAKMVSPTQIGDPIYESTNQSPIATSSKVDLQVDDYMFLRPTQSEFVMLQFGDLRVVEDGQLSSRWPVFHQTG